MTDHGVKKAKLKLDTSNGAQLGYILQIFECPKILPFELNYPTEGCIKNIHLKAHCCSNALCKCFGQPTLLDLNTESMYVHGFS